MFRTAVGNFAKDTGGAPDSQVVTGIGFQPKVLIMWTAGKTAAGSFSGSYRAAIGFSTGAANSFSQASAAQDAVADSNTSQRVAAKALAIVEWGESLLAECDLTSFDSDGFTLDWTTNDANAYIIHYLALGGEDLTHAKVLNWQCPATAIEQAVTGFGFAPDCLINLVCGTTGAVPTTSTYSDLGLGAAVKGGGEWSCHSRSEDAAAAADTGRSFVENLISACTETNGFFVRGGVRSFDSDGFTAKFWTVFSGVQIITLGLKGGSYRAGILNKIDDSATATQKIATPGSRIRGLLLASTMSVGPGFATTQNRFGVGATDGTNEGSIALTDADAATTMNVDAISKTDKALMIVDNATPAVDAECDITLSGEEATLSWTTNHAVCTYIGYLAFGDSPLRKPRAQSLIGV